MNLISKSERERIKKRMAEPDLGSLNGIHAAYEATLAEAIRLMKAMPNKCKYLVTVPDCECLHCQEVAAFLTHVDGERT